MGKPLEELETNTKAAILIDRQLSKPIKNNSITMLLDSLFVLNTEDSVKLLSLMLEGLQRNTRMEKRWLLRDVPSILPLRILSFSSFRISSGFGLRYHPITDKVHNHSGIDLPQPLLSSVYATADGHVDRIVFQPQGLGVAVYIRHWSGYTTVYGHLNDHNVVVGEFIERGEEIGRVGTTGISTGPHLHYAVLDRGIPVDPADFCFLLLKAINRQNAAVAQARPSPFKASNAKNPASTVKR